MSAEKRHFAFVLATLIALAWVPGGCDPRSGKPPAQQQDPAGPEEGPELATLMGDLQRHSHKLGLALEAGNQPLAEFYLHEVEEVLDEVAGQVPVHDGHPVGELVETIMVPTLEELEEKVDAGELQAAREGYPRFVDGCNRCHAATEHQFIVITADVENTPFNQRFQSPNQ